MNQTAFLHGGRVAFVLTAVIIMAIDGPAANAADEPVAKPSPELFTMETAQAVMVTVELDIDKAGRTIAEAISKIERRQKADGGNGRVFAVLDAYGGPTEDGKKLHISMHVSSERPGLGELVFKPTGEVLWRGKIVPATKPPTSSFAGKGLFIMVDDANGKPWVLNGSGNPKTVLDTTVRDLKKPLRDIWQDGDEREVTLIYSACGCPVKVMARRQGDLTVRTKDTPVIFPDDPAVARTINKLMGWE
jgi:hypothetical protein